jgi:hypothetical protein
MIRKLNLLCCCCFLAVAGYALAEPEQPEKIEQPEPVQDSKNDLSVQDILERDATVGDYTNEVNCLSARRMRGTDVLDSRHVTFKMGRDEYYLVQFKHRCVGLRSNRPVRLNMRNSRLCKFDSIQGIDPSAMAGMREGLRCSIPGFTQMTKAQVEQLKSTLKDERARARALAKEERRRIREERKARRRGDA